MKKKVLSLLLVSTLVIAGLSGCQSKDGSESKTDTKSTENVAAVDTKKVFVSPEWVKSVIDGNQKESKKYVIGEVAWGSEADDPTYKEGHLVGAIHIDTGSIEAEPKWNLRSPDEVKKALQDVGITKDTTVILYGPDPSGTARVAYAYLWAGVENVKILNGGLDAWKKAGYDLETKSNKAKAVADFGANVPVHPEYQMSIEQVQKKLESDKNFKLVSIRTYDEFIGKTSGYSYIKKAGEPKGAVWGKAGSDASHMEDYMNEDGTYKNIDQLKELWKGLDFTTDNELSFYCGTGWRAAIPFLVMYDAGYTNMSMYDGGWFEWQMNNNLPVQIGDPKKDVKYTTVGELSDDKAVKEN